MAATRMMSVPAVLPRVCVRGGRLIDPANAVVICVTSGLLMAAWLQSLSLATVLMALCQRSRSMQPEILSAPA